MPVDRDLRMMTSKIKNSETVGELFDLLDAVVDKPIFNYIHAAVAYTKLRNLEKRDPLGTKEAKSGVLVRLEQRLQGLVAQIRKP